MLVAMSQFQLLDEDEVVIVYEPGASIVVATLLALDHELAYGPLVARTRM